MRDIGSEGGQTGESQVPKHTRRYGERPQRCRATGRSSERWRDEYGRREGSASKVAGKAVEGSLCHRTPHSQVHAEVRKSKDRKRETEK